MRRLTTSDMLSGLTRDQKLETLAAIRGIDDPDARAAQRDVELILAAELEGRPVAKHRLPQPRRAAS